MQPPSSRLLLPVLLITLFTIGTLLIQSCQAGGFDSNLFKKCHQHDFCENLRPGLVQKQALYQKVTNDDASSSSWENLIKATASNKSPHLEFQLLSQNREEYDIEKHASFTNQQQQDDAFTYPKQLYTPLNVRISLYSGSFRLQIKEMDAVDKEALSEDVIVAKPIQPLYAKENPLIGYQIDNKQDLIVYSKDSPKSQLKISVRPFRVELLQDGEVTAVFNRDDFLYVDSKLVKEQLQAKFNEQKPEVPHQDAAAVNNEQQEANSDDTKKDEGENTPEDENKDSSSSVAAPTFSDVIGKFKLTSVHSEKVGGASSFDMYFPKAQHVYGIPERPTDLSLQSTVGKEPYRLFNSDVFRYELDNPLGLYGSIPFMFSLGKDAISAGILAMNPSKTFVDVDKQSEGISTHWIHEVGLLDVFLIPGPTPKDVLLNYIKITGKPMMPQLFSMAYHQCRWNYKDEDDVFQVAEKFDEYNIPFDVLWLDIEHTDAKKYFTWEKHDFPTPLKMQEHMKQKGRKMVTISDPHIKREKGYFVHDEAESKGYYVKDRNGNNFEGDCWPGKSSWLDFFSPEVRSWYASLYKYDKYKGSTDILFTWIDMNEPSVEKSPEITMPPDNVHYGGKTHREVHNLYGYYQSVATHEGHLLRSDNKERPFVLTRSFFAGSQRYVAAWSGDNTADWAHLKKTPAMLMSVSMAGFPFIGSDVGGFFDNPETELLIRWYQSGAFYPFFRAHAHIETKRREIWLFGEDPLALMREAIIRRYVLLPYYYTLSFESARNGMPIMRSLFFEYPNDPETYEEQNQFLIGKDLMVVPVSEKGQTSVSVYFPGKGSWYEWNDASLVTRTGPVRHTVQTPLEYIPVYQRGGSIIPVKERVRRSSSQMKNDPYTLRVALSNKHDARGELYIDDGHSYKFREGRYLLRQFRVTPDSRDGSKFTIANKEGNSSGAESAADPSYAQTVLNTVERIIVSGVNKEPSKVTLEKVSEEGSTPATPIDLLVLVDFDYDKEKKTLTIRKPPVLIRDDWEMHVE